jgi:photosystem II stability/assembly factor-like uncharacterized protein
MLVGLSPNGSNEHTAAGPPTRLVVGTVYGVTDLERAAPGARWDVAAHALPGRHVSALLVEPCRGGLFASVHGGGVFASADGGRTWERRTTGLAHDHVWTLASREVAGEVELYAGAQPAHLYRSADYGATWAELASLLAVGGQERWMFPPPPRQPHVKSVAFDPTDPRVLYVGIEQGALLKSADGGASWRELDGYYRETDVFYKDMHRIMVSPADPRRIYLATGDGLYLSEDAGETWEHLVSPHGSLVGYPDGLVLAPGDDRTLFMAGGAAAPPEWRRTGRADASVARSRDGGRTWEPLDLGVPVPLRANIEALSLCAWPGGFSLFAGTTDGDVFASDDGGTTWGPIARGLGPVSQSSHYRDLPRQEPVPWGASLVGAR